MTYAIDARQLRKVYGAVTALDQISLQVASGEIFGFLGPNGAGKSTFVKILLKLIAPTSGEATLFGREVGGLEARRGIGFLPENIRAYTFLTAEEFVRFHAELADIPRNRIKTEAERCLELAGMLTHRKKRMSTLSKGMTQRVAIAQAILGSPRLLLLDEPTSGLDPIGIKELRTLLLELQQQGTTMLLSSHLLSEVERTCDRVAILNRGRIIRMGSREDLTGKDRHLEVVVDGFTDAMASKIQALTRKAPERNGNVLQLYPAGEEDSVAIHKIIIDGGGRLISLAWKGESLEELFYRLVKDEDMGNS
ncbi:ABC transporter ATP-binding protein [Thermodesulfobacteriota bacterium]